MELTVTDIATATLAFWIDSNRRACRLRVLVLLAVFGLDHCGCTVAAPPYGKPDVPVIAVEGPIGQGMTRQQIEAAVREVEAAAQDCDGIPPPCIPNLPKGATTMPGSTVPAPPDEGPAAIDRASLNAIVLFNAKRYDDLDNLIARYATLQDRVDDGRFKLSGISKFIRMAFDQRAPGVLLTDVERWRAANPQSPGAALLEADYWVNAAWQARGSGYANSVSPEGWRLFHERLERAQKALSDSEPYASSNPLWYIEGLVVRRGLNASTNEQLAFYERGLKGFPEFFPLHFTLIEALLPKWGGSNEAIRAFIESVVKRSPPSLKAQMYTRLWWDADNASPLHVDVFRDMGASWARMKEGFDSLDESYPNSVWNRGNYASFACRAGDVTTYIRLRTELGDKINIYVKKIFPSNASLDVCDERAAPPGSDHHGQNENLKY
jgi:hypothetical protein